MAGAMIFGGASAVFADTATTTATTTTNATQSVGVFKDVKTGFWAEKHIIKLASQGIVVGNNGLFRPGDPVTQQEAVLMALRFVKLQDKVDSTSAVALPTDFKVSNYYKDYVVLAFQQGLLDKATEMAPDNLKNSWGERKASREWIAELLVRALGKGSDAAVAATQPTGFADDAKVSANKRGYINVAVNLKLANGLDGNRFDPQGAVTRAQLATFFSRAEAHNSIEYDNTITGSVSQLKDGKLTVYNNGKSTTYNLGANTAYYSSTSESRISLNEIQPYTKVTVIGANDNAAYVEVTDPTPQVESLSGTFAMIAPGNKIFLKSTTGFPEYYYDETTTFVDASGAAIEPASIIADSVVTLQRETYSGSHRVIKVQVTSGVVNKTATGTIKSIDLTKKSITFKNAAGSEETFTWEDGTSFSQKSSMLQPADLKAGSAVKYIVQENKIRSVEVTEGVERTVQGVLTELTKTTIVYKKADGTPEVKLLATKPTIVIPNISSAVADDLIADTVGGDKIQVTLNSNDQVIKIEVQSRQIDQFNGAAIVAYDSKTKILTVMDTNKKPHAIQLDEKTKLILDVVVPNISSIGPKLVENRKVNIKAIGERALSLEIVTQYEGVITSVNSSSRTIVLKLQDGTSLTLPYPQAIDLFGKSNPTYSDIPIGSNVIATLTSNQELVASLKVRSSLQVEATTINSVTNRLGIKWNGGTSEMNTYTLPITNEAGESIKLTDLKAGDFLNVTFDGSAPIAVQLVKLTTGQVNTVDAAANSLVVKDFAGVAHNIAVSGGVRIIRDGSTTSALSNLTATDRVELRKDTDGVTIIRVLPQLNKFFSRYESATNSLSTKRSNFNENYQFILAPNVFIHQGDTTLSVQSLKENDNIILYFNNDVVVEIVKQ